MVVLTLNCVPWIQSLPIIFDFVIFHPQGLVLKMLKYCMEWGSGGGVSLHLCYQFTDNLSLWLKKNPKRKIHPNLLSKPLCCTVLEVVWFLFFFITQGTRAVYHKQTYHKHITNSTIFLPWISTFISHLGKHIPTSFPRGFTAAREELFCESPCLNTVRTPLT